jgi:membrane protein YqaA with SNARE-associated domain
MGALVGVYWALVILYPDLTSPFSVVYLWVYNFSLLAGYPGLFAICFLGNATVIVPFPYFVTTFVFGGLRDISLQFVFDPVIVGLISGIGACLGDMTGYAIGYAGGHYVQSSQRDAFQKLLEAHPRWTPLVIWFLAITPLPDDIVIVPLGAARYSWWRVIIPQSIGKIMFLTAIAWSGRLGLQWVQDLITSEGPSTILSRSVEPLTLLLVLAAVYLLIRIDWSKLMMPKAHEATPEGNDKSLGTQTS